MTGLSVTDLLAIENLREKGYAVMWFSPEELDGVETSAVEDRMLKEGQDMIHWLQGPGRI